MTWQDVLDAIHECNEPIPVTPKGIPLVAINAPFFELMQLMAEITNGYNTLVLRDKENKQRIDRIRKLAKAHFPAEYRAKTDEWVSVKDALPQKSGVYLTYDKTSGIYAYPYSAINKKFNSHDHDSGEYAICVEYWHPSPLPPVKEAKQ